MGRPVPPASAPGPAPPPSLPHLGLPAAPRPLFFPPSPYTAPKPCGGWGGATAAEEGLAKLQLFSLGKRRESGGEVQNRA